MWISNFILVISFLLAGGAQATAQTLAQTWHDVRILLPTHEDEVRLHALHLEFDHAHGLPGRWVQTHLTQQSLDKLRTSGLQFEILQTDMAAFYAARIKAHKNTGDELLDLPAGMRLGSVGGFYRLDEAYAEMERLRQTYPQLVAHADTLGFTHENRPILAWRVGDQNGVKQGECLLTALHHAREPASLTTLVFALWEILERHKNGEREIQQLLATRGLVVVPVVNPDGYAFNLRLSPRGGGLWRKNTRVNEDGETGVDLNRNYGPEEAWDAANGGSHERTESELYRGPAAFSEPETRAIRDLCLSRDIRIAVNFHSFGELYIRPFSYVESAPSDSLAYDALFRLASRDNGYSGGRDVLTVRYSARGVSDDWMALGPGLDNPIRAFTPEVGSADDGFWPPAWRIPQIGRDNLTLIEEAWWSAGANPHLTSVNMPDGRAAADSLQLKFNNLGTQILAAGWSVSLSSGDSQIELPSGFISVEQALAPGESAVITLPVKQAAERPDGKTLNIQVEISFDGVQRTYNASLQFGEAQLIDLAPQSWSTESGWGTETDANTQQSLLSDSPGGDYPRTRFRASQSIDIDLTSAARAVFSFEARWQIESNFDGCFIEISSDGGESWQELASAEMKRATAWPGSAQTAGRWYLQGARLDWSRLDIALDQFAGKRIKLRFGMAADAANQFDGIQLRKLFVRAFNNKTAISTNTTSFNISPNPLAFDKPLQLTIAPGTDLRDARVIIYNLFGAHVLDRALSDFSRRGETFYLPLRELGTGRYLIVLDTPFGADSTPLLIIR